MLDFVQGEGSMCFVERNEYLVGVVDPPVEGRHYVGTFTRFTVEAVETIYSVDEHRAKLSNVQTLRIIEATRKALPGWPSHLPPEWYANVRVEAQSLPQKPHAPPLDDAAYHKLVARPRSVRRSFDALLVATDDVYSSLARRPIRAIVDELRTKAKKLRSAKPTAEALWLAPNLRAAGADIDRQAKRYEFQADCLEREPRSSRALERLTPHLVLCFEQIFCRAATGGRHAKENSPSDDADSPYVRFARAYLSELGCGHRPLTIQKALYEIRKATRKLA